MREGKIKGPIGDKKLRQDAHELSDIEVVESIKKVNHDELQVTVNLINPTFGLPSDLHDWMSASGYRIKDFSHVSEQSVTVYMADPRR